MKTKRSISKANIGSPHDLLFELEHGGFVRKVNTHSIRDLMVRS